MTINVSPTEPRPTHHVKLTHGSDTIGLILCDAQGNAKETGIDDIPYPQGSLKTYSGEQTHADMEPPFTPVSQSDWSSGRGNLDFDKNAAMYFDGYRINTGKDYQVIAGAQEGFTHGYRKDTAYTPMGEVAGIYYNYKNISNLNVYACKITATDTFTTENISLWIRKEYGADVDLWLDLCADDAAGGGVPGTVLESAYADYQDTDIGVSTYKFYPFDIAQAITSGTDYWLVVYTKTISAIAVPWRILTEYQELTYDILRADIGYGTAWDGQTWSAIRGSFIYRIVDSDKPYTAHFFKYKGVQLAAWSYTDGSTPKLWINGDWGIVDSGTNDTLVDGSKSWDTDEFVNCVVRLMYGTGSEADTPWRLITANDATSITVDSDWDINPSTDTEYVIVACSKWREISGHGLTGPITQVLSYNNIVYFCQGDIVNLLRARWYNNAGTWTAEYDDDGTNKAQFLIPLHTSAGSFMWKANRLPVPSIIESDVKAWGYDLMFDVEMIMIVPDRDFSAAGHWTGTNWAISSAKFKHTAGAGNTDPATLFNEYMMPSKIIKGRDFLVTFTISGRTAGDIIPKIGTGGTEGYTTDGTYYATIKASADNEDLTFTPSADFDGSIDNISVLKQHIPLGDGQEQVTGLEVYGDPTTLYIFTEGSVYYLDGNDLVEKQLRELHSVADARNGKVHLVHNLYLYFSVLNTWQRYYSTSLDSVGPDIGEGLPEERSGTPSDAIGYAGRYYLAIDGGDDHYSSVLENNGKGWNETFRSHNIGQRIRKIDIQTIPGDNIDRLWISMGSDMLWLPIDINPWTAPKGINGYRFNYESYYISSKFYLSLQDVSKFFNAVKITAENNLGLNVGVFSGTIEVDYAVDDSDDFIPLAGIFDSYSEEQKISILNDISGKCMQMRPRMYTGHNTQTPRLINTILEAITRLPQKYVHNITFRMADNDKDLNGDPDETILLSTKELLLKSWAASSTPCYMNTLSATDDGMYVFLDSLNIKRLKKIKIDNIEYQICQTRLIGID
jgi:hypothetical protein